MLNALKRRGERRQAILALMEGLLARARAPVFYAELGVPDTIDGRFDLLALHAWLLLDSPAIRQDRGVSQAIIDQLFIHFDEALREQGAGDIGMSRRINKMADAFYGRLRAYGDAQDREALVRAIVRNVFRGDEGQVDAASKLAMYVEEARAHLAAARLQEAEFGPLPRP